MEYQELLRAHSYFYQRRPKHIPADASGLGLLEYHASLPGRQEFFSQKAARPEMQAVTTDDQLAQSGIGETVKPEAFPHTGYLGPGVGGN
ncbi:MAG TPA: hypothetical protein VLH15_04320 [Dehalococcoidales bacterium]|nr:hypothetical protein [Dehalococcoidales bacterium]